MMMPREPSYGTSFGTKPSSALPDHRCLCGLKRPDISGVGNGDHSEWASRRAKCATILRLLSTKLKRTATSACVPRKLTIPKPQPVNAMEYIQLAGFAVAISTLPLCTSLDKASESALFIEVVSMDFQTTTRHVYPVSLGQVAYAKWACDWAVPRPLDTAKSESLLKISLRMSQQPSQAPKLLSESVIDLSSIPNHGRAHYWTNFGSGFLTVTFDGLVTTPSTAIPASPLIHKPDQFPLSLSLDTTPGKEKPCLTRKFSLPSCLSFRSSSHPDSYRVLDQHGLNDSE